MKTSVIQDLMHSEVDPSTKKSPQKKYVQIIFLFFWSGFWLMGSSHAGGVLLGYSLFFWCWWNKLRRSMIIIELAERSSHTKYPTNCFTKNDAIK